MLYNLFLKSLRLKNYCQYKDTFFEFVDSKGVPYPYVCFYGPNGVGKTNILKAIGLLAMNTAGRPKDRIKDYMAKYVANTNFDPLFERVLAKAPVGDMLIEGVFLMDGKEYCVILNENGFVRNDFCPVPPVDCDPEEALSVMQSGPFGSNHLAYRQRMVHFITTNSDISLNQFQIHGSQKEDFERLVTEVCRYTAKVIEPSGTTAEDKEFSTDFVLEKPNATVHFKRMSLGERKISKSFSSLLNLVHALKFPRREEPAMPGWPRLLIMDELESSVYYDRHVRFVDSLKGVFQGHQFFGTTHSGVLIPRHKRGEHSADELYFDLEAVLG